MRSLSQPLEGPREPQRGLSKLGPLRGLSQSLRDLTQGYVKYKDINCVDTSGEEDIVDTRRAVSERNKVTRRLTRNQF